MVFEISTTSVILALLLATNGNVWATNDPEGCGFSDPNPDSFELDQLCQELGDNPECFDEHGKLADICAEQLEAQGSQEYENYKQYLNSTNNSTK